MLSSTLYLLKQHNRLMYSSGTDFVLNSKQTEPIQSFNVLYGKKCNLNREL